MVSLKVELKDDSAYTRIVVPTGAPTLYYYCHNHSGMGNTQTLQFLML